MPAVSLKSKVVLITGFPPPRALAGESLSAASPPPSAGASSGIGKACAEQFAEAGCVLLLCARQIDKLRELKAQLEERHEGVRVEVAQLDVCDRAAVANVLSLFPEDLQDVHVLVNNAGLALGTAAVHESRVEVRCALQACAGRVTQFS